jgi:RimJ/RimL family protein N-acetyltransferase
MTRPWASDERLQLRSTRLLLRRPSIEDAAEALVLLRDPDVVRWNPAPAVIDLASAQQWCLRGADWSDDSHATWHAIDPITQQLVANVSLFTIDTEHATAKVGYRVSPQWRRRNLGTEALTTVSEWAFDALGLARIQLEHAVANVGSCQVALRSGYQLEGTLRSAYLDSDGVRHDEHVHARLAVDVVSAGDA